MERHLWIDNKPTGVVLQGHDLTGLPQGCPLATFYANLLSAIWEIRVRSVCSVEIMSYLDDRVILAETIDQLEAALAATAEFDACFGIILNDNKSVFGSTQNKLKPSIALAARFKVVSNLVYLGVDVTLAGGAQRTRAKERLKDLASRCKLIGRLSSQIRGKLVADAVSSLWLEGGSWYSKTELEKATSLTAAALRGHDNGHAGRRCRDVEHMLSYKPHRTHPLMAAMLANLRLLTQLSTLPHWTTIHWNALWQRRHKAMAGPAAQAWYHFRHTLVTGDDDMTVSYRTPQATLTCALVHHLSTSLRARFYHDVRELLRNAFWGGIAAARPKDFGGLENGCGFRDTISKLYHTAGAPSVFCGGTWTMMKAYIANLADDPVCPRCLVEDETTEHMYWECPCGKQERDKLLAAFPGLDYTSLPNCLRRCGLPPADCDLQFNELTITHYLIAQHLDATPAYLEAKRLQQHFRTGGTAAGCTGSTGTPGTLATPAATGSAGALGTGSRLATTTGAGTTAGKTTTAAATTRHRSQH